jgi:hypothetical protein
MISQTSPNHKWRFFRAGALDQVKFERAEDFTELEKLDLKLWVALSCPTRGIDLDPSTLDLIDTDNDGRIRAPELLAAVKWATSHLKDPAELRLGNTKLPLSSIDDQTPHGRALLASAHQILENLGKDDSEWITPGDTQDTAKILAKTNFNGDGIITVGTSMDSAIHRVIEEIIDTIGPVFDCNGIGGVSQDSIESFYRDLASFGQWWQKGEEDSRAGSGVLPLDDDTPAGYEAYKEVKVKLADYFNRCRLAAYDDRAAEPLNLPQSEYVALAPKDLSVIGHDIEQLPLQKIDAKGDFDLREGINPAWTKRIQAFTQRVVAPLLGAERTILSYDDWIEIVERLNTYEDWVTKKAGGSVEKLGITRIREILAGHERAEIEALIARDAALAPEADGIGNVNKLVLFYRDLARLLRNYVSFEDFHNPNTHATFQAGTLFLDQRGCNLCVEITDPAKHAALGSRSRMYIAYCDLSRPSVKSKKIAACFTQGDSDYLMVGRNGVFYDRRGLDWDAQIRKVVEFPISVRQAFFLPYKKFVRFIEEQVAKRAAAAQEESDAKLAATAKATAEGKPAAEPAKVKRIDVGTVAAIGVAISGFVSVITAIIGGILGLGLWQIPLAVIGVLLAISGPSMLIAWLKLRQRTLGPILDANGWAINGRIKVNVSLATRLTDAKALPPNASRQFSDPYEQRKRWPMDVLCVLILAVVGYGIYAHINNFWPFQDEVSDPIPVESAPAKSMEPDPK